MKLLQDMTTDEICSMTEEQLDLRVKLECAEQGIPLLPEPPTIEAFDLVKDVIAYRIPGTEFYFKDESKAKELLVLLEKHQSDLFTEQYDWRTGYDVKWLTQSERNLTLETHTFYNEKVVHEREQFLVKRKNAKEAYDRQKKSFEASRDKYRKLADGVYTEYYEAKTKKRQIEDARKTFQEYLALANNDGDKARVFFDKALKPILTEEVYNAVFA